MFESYFMLTFSEAIAHQLSSPYNSHIRTALDACWSFWENRDKSGDEIYALLDDGTDFGGLFIYMQLDDNESHVVSWDNISYAIATTAKEAYSYENKKDLPSPLENIDNSLIEIFIENLKEINSNFYDHVQDVKDFLARCQLPSKEEALKELERIGLLL
ncbi:Imm6 family immunity protein [Streptococcus sp. oral taxon 431]|uniref:Imm6 family immunity protein n=1 Tax=Streptococcus sp. oral taxon 431 TaxID=712633 RepID=UPI002001D6B9|nr:Imm6 family immunity protein [Streptococcus sp. oral taxon 431]